MTDTHGDLIDWAAFSKARTELGADFIRILGYFREDGVKSVAAIESAMRASDATALVLPSHTLKGEARQFGADPLGDLAERIEVVARRCVEHQEKPDELVADVVRLRTLFDDTLDLFERETNPLVARKPQAGFGRRQATAGGFGRG